MNDETSRNGVGMNGQPPNHGRHRRITRRVAWLGVAGVCATWAALVPVSASQPATAAFAGESEGLQCTDGTTSDVAGVTHRGFDITATDGYTSEPDGNAIYDWGYSNSGGAFQLPGPVLCAQQGDVLEIHLHNALPVATSIQFPGQTDVQYSYNASPLAPDGPVAGAGGALASLVHEAPPNGDVTYTFAAAAPGTYLYQSGSDPQLQVQMGLFGALVVRPGGISITADDILAIPNDGGPTGVRSNADAGVTEAAAIAAAATARCAYPSPTAPGKCDPLAIYDGSRENLLVLSEIDPGVHSYAEQHRGTAADLHWNAYPGAYEAHYFMINGRSMPDTLAPNNAPWLPSQPYGAMAHVQPWDALTNPLDALLRYVGVGVTGYDFHPHSNHEHVIAEDAVLMKGATGNDNTEEKFNIMVGSGSTVDATFRWTNEVGYSDTDGKRVPVAWPQGLNLSEGDFWSGSPYLGESGTLNPGILTKTQCGEYYHVAHSHDLTQATNYGITFGGMLTLIKVEPPDEVQNALHLDCNG